MIPYTPTTITSTSQSPRVGPLKFETPRNEEHGEPSCYGEQQKAILDLINEYNPTISTLNNRIKGRKIRHLKELYEQKYEIDHVSNFPLLPYDPGNFDEVVKEKVWIKDMDEETHAKERNNTLELIDFPEGKNFVGVKWI